jgi:peptidoglycan biosynthesis protein MviN/MurJ (putative lipid II flippase)
MSVGFVLLGLGSAVFAYLLLKSRYIPKALAGWGIFSSLVRAVGTLAIMVFPSLGAVGLVYMMPMGICEVGLGLWLLIKGIQAPPVADSTAL